MVIFPISIIVHMFNYVCYVLCLRCSCVACWSCCSASCRAAQLVTSSSCSSLNPAPPTLATHCCSTTSTRTDSGNLSSRSASSLVTSSCSRIPDNPFFIFFFSLLRSFLSACCVATASTRRTSSACDWERRATPACRCSSPSCTSLPPWSAVSSTKSCTQVCFLRFDPPHSAVAVLSAAKIKEECFACWYREMAKVFASYKYFSKKRSKMLLTVVFSFFLNCSTSKVCHQW